MATSMAFTPKTPFTFDPQASDNTYADHVRAEAEGWYALEAVAIDEASRKTCALKISECLNKAAELGEESYNAEEEHPWSEPHASIYALRMALRALMTSQSALAQAEGYVAKRAREMNREAVLAIGNALVSIELPE